MRRSWLRSAVETYTSPTEPPRACHTRSVSGLLGVRSAGAHAARALKPPAVPALRSKSGLSVLSTAYVASAAGTVPTEQTPKRASVPLVTTKSSTPCALPFQHPHVSGPGSSPGASFSPMCSTKGAASGCIAAGLGVSAGRSLRSSLFAQPPQPRSSLCHFASAGRSARSSLCLFASARRRQRRRLGECATQGRTEDDGHPANGPLLRHGAPLLTQALERVSRNRW